ncbi:MAG TPA: hypothetical protein PK530_06900 [Anaerolineales bacterium]|nr:hypothetical protein [Anaerolineales bacterium]
MQFSIGARVLILVEAPGYQSWEMEIEKVEYVPEKIEMQVELLPLE